MAIKDFKLHNFRNYEQEIVRFSPGTNILIGKNGQGKTNILEGLYYLLTGKSYRVQRELELIRWGEKGFALEGQFLLQKKAIRLEIAYQDKKKSVMINRVPCQKLSNYLGTVNVVFFSPDDLVLIKGGPKERRNFLDLHIAQLQPSYIAVLNNYNKVLMQKSALLKSPLGKKQKTEQLHLWNEQLLIYGEKIINMRHKFLNNLNEVAKKIYQSLSSQTEMINISYSSLGFTDLDKILSSFPQLLETKIEEEIEKEMILVGPHRDDLKVNLNKNSARLYGSQGQQRSIVLSLKLAELEIINQEKDEYPLLLLDDVLSELDEIRREYLISYIERSKIQSVITMTSAERGINADALFEVSQGNIRRKD